jgi:CysZ protein
MKKVVVGYFKGLTYPFRGMKLVFIDHPSLFRFWIFPIVITILVLALVMKGVWDYHDALVTLIWEEPTGEGFVAGLLAFLHGFVEVIVAIFGFALGIVVVYLLTTIFAAPFNDALSEEVESIVTGRPGPPFSLRVVLRDTVRTVGLEAMKMLVLLLVLGPLFIASLLVPVIGQIAYSVFGFLFTALYFAIDYVDWPASRRNKGVAYRFGLAVEHFLPMFGFGTGVWVFLFVPFLNLLFMPAAVAGGTLLYLDLEPGGVESPANPPVEASPPTP